MSRDCAERDTLRGVADSLVGERTSLQRRLLQIRSELESETKDAEALEQGAQSHPSQCLGHDSYGDLRGVGVWGMTSTEIFMWDPLCGASEAQCMREGHVRRVCNCCHQPLHPRA
jgi:hypothetical protein